MIQLKSFTKDAASRTKGLQLKTKLEHAIKEERNISVDFDGIDKFASPFFNMRKMKDKKKYATRLDWGEIPGLFLLKKVATKLLIFVAT